LINNKKKAEQWIEARLELQSPVFSDKCAARLNNGTTAILPDSPFNISCTYQNKQQLGIYLNINRLDALNFIMSLFHASTCFEHKCSEHVEA